MTHKLDDPTFVTQCDFKKFDMKWILNEKLDFENGAVLKSKLFRLKFINTVTTRFLNERIKEHS